MTFSSLSREFFISLSHDTFIFHRCSVDLSALKRDFTHDLWVSLEDGAGRLHLLVSVSGLSDLDPIHDLAALRPREVEADIERSMTLKK